MATPTGFQYPVYVITFIPIPLNSLFNTHYVCVIISSYIVGTFKEVPMTGSIQIKTTKSGKRMLYIVLYYRNPSTLKGCTKWVSTGLEEKGNKRKASSLIPEYIEKYKYLEHTTSELSADMPFVDYYKQWLEKKKTDGSIELSTWEGYKLHSTHIIRYFSNHNIKLAEIKPKHFQEYYDYQLQYGKVNQRTKERSGLAPRTVRSHKNLIVSALNQAIIDGIITTNPAQYVAVRGKRNKDYRKKEVFLTIAEANDYLTFISKNYPRLLIIAYLGIYYGFRRSEMLGLTWESIDFESHKITVNRTVVKMISTIEKERTKTKSSNRTLDLLPNVEKLLKQLKQQQELNQKFFGDTYHTSPYILCWEDGRPYAPDYLTHAFMKAAKTYGKPELTLHKLRHSCASILFEMGWTPKEIQHWLGHADYYTTMNIYTHLSSENLSYKSAALNDSLMLIGNN